MALLLRSRTSVMHIVGSSLNQRANLTESTIEIPSCREFGHRVLAVLNMPSTIVFESRTLFPWKGKTVRLCISRLGREIISKVVRSILVAVFGFALPAVAERNSSRIREKVFSSGTFLIPPGTFCGLTLVPNGSRLRLVSVSMKAWMTRLSNLFFPMFQHLRRVDDEKQQIWLAFRIYSSQCFNIFNVSMTKNNNLLPKQMSRLPTNFSFICILLPTLSQRFWRSLVRTPLLESKLPPTIFRSVRTFGLSCRIKVFPSSSLRYVLPGTRYRVPIYCRNRW